MARLMQVGERLHHHTIGLLESLRAFRVCGSRSPRQTMPLFYGTFLDLNSIQRCSQAICLSAPPGRRDRTTERRAMQAHLSQVTEMPDDSRAVRLAMSRIQAIARSNFAGRHPVPSVALYI